MKSFLAVIGLLLCLGGTTAHARSEVSGFQGMRWGSSLTELQKSKQLILTKENDGSGGSLYALKNESMRFGKATLTGIHCSFVQGRLQGVILLFAGNKNYQGVKAEATSRYGKPIQVDQKGGEMFTWPGDRTSIVLSYTKNVESGFLFLKPKKPVTRPEPAARPAPVQATKPAPSRENSDADDLALLDQASQQQTIAVEPATDGPSPGETPGTGPDQAATVDMISPEVQGLIDRDQALTRLCWDTVGPVADQACEQMKENVQRIQEMGWCMKPGEAQDGLQVIWYYCGNPQAGTAAPPTSATAAPPAAAAAPTPNPRTSICSLVMELFAATANLRDKEVTPLAAEEALMQRQSGRARQLAIEQIRETVELVYFDQQYNNLPLQELMAKVEQQCFSGNGPYIQPLPQQ